MRLCEQAANVDQFDTAWVFSGWDVLRAEQVEGGALGVEAGGVEELIEDLENALKDL